MMWACFHYGGTGRAVLVEGTMNSAKYCDEVINRSVVPQLDDWYPAANSIFQQDNAPSHASRTSKAHFAVKGVTLFDWPPSSPDANPIENLCSIAKNRLLGMQSRNKNDLTKNFIHVWHG